MNDANSLEKGIPQKGVVYLNQEFILNELPEHPKSIYSSDPYKDIESREMTLKIPGLPDQKFFVSAFPLGGKFSGIFALVVLSDNEIDRGRNDLREIDESRHDLMGHSVYKYKPEVLEVLKRLRMQIQDYHITYESTPTNALDRARTVFRGFYIRTIEQGEDISHSFDALLDYEYKLPPLDPRPRMNLIGGFGILHSLAKAKFILADKVSDEIDIPPGIRNAFK